MALFRKEKYKDNKKVVNLRKIRLKKFFSTKRLLFIGFMAVMIVMFMMSPFFLIKTINIADMERYNREEILTMANLKEGKNIFSFSALKTEKILEENTYFESVNIKRIFPNSIDIEINERKVRGYVPYMGSYLYIDEYGRILETSTGFTKQLPVVEGLKFDRFTIGEKIDADNVEAFNVMVIIAQMMTKYELLDMVVKIDVSDIENIKANVDKIEVNLGDISNSEQKIRTMGEIIKKIPKGDRGTLDISDLSKPLIFKYLT